jgi:hypothetical protein
MWQGCGSGSALIEKLDPDPGGQNDPQKYKKVNNFHVLKCWMFSFEG